MTESNEISYVCGFCGQHSNYLPTGGLIHTDSMTFPIKLFPDCGPTQWEVLQFCREITLGAFQN